MLSSIEEVIVRNKTNSKKMKNKKLFNKDGIAKADLVCVTTPDAKRRHVIRNRHVHLNSFLPYSLVLVLLLSIHYTGRVSGTLHSSSSWISNLPGCPPRTIITWVNGIGHTASHMIDGQQMLSQIFGNRPIEYCHNPTNMASEDDTFGYIGDLTQCTSQKLGKITSEVNQLVTHLRDAVQKVGATGKVIHIAHSQGALITSLAMKKLRKDEMKQIEVICFGGAEVIRKCKEFPFARCINYYSVNDPLLFVVPQAAKALRSGFLGMGYGSVRMSNGSPQSNGVEKFRRNSLETNDGSDDEDGMTGDNTLAALADPNHEPQFVFLTPREGDPVKDHGLFGATYRDALLWEGRRYQKLYVSSWHTIIYATIAYSHALRTTIYEALVSIIMLIFRNTILRIVLFVQYVNAMVKERVIVPIAIFLYILWEKFVDFIRTVKGEESYEPIVVDQVK
ncbi:hypothetical protein CTEN210_14117 [Chaetoceros tenuissimus]|uniref:Uncharacterized protein n=1 Tax=Chaetoceros tenuissimus TaxID=426638 RepID=A0AAD3D4C7_9STRA|nr:hypothetical protein CTEN210_14117 [Chaetoceros tenuissimus]